MIRKPCEWLKTFAMVGALSVISDQETLRMVENLRNGWCPISDQ
ncbi:MAG: hypothetical protein ACLFQM_12140 [Fidelibacterota bacterium]